MKNIKLLTLTLLVLIGLVSCMDENKVLAIPPSGALVTITPDGTSVFDLNDASGSIYSGELKDATNNVESYTLMASVYYKSSRTESAAVEVYSTSTFPANMAVSAADALAALGLTTSDVTPGDLVQFRAVITTTDGRSFDHTTLNGDATGEALLGAYTWDVPFFCPFVTADAVGTYDVVVGDNIFGWAPAASTVEAVAIDGGIRFVDMFGPGKHLNVTVDPETAAASARSELLADSTFGYSGPYINQSGSAYFFSCTGSYEALFQTCVDLGCFSASSYPVPVTLTRR